MDNLIDGKLLAAKVRSVLKEKIELLDFQPQITTIQVGDAHAGSNLYIKYKHDAAHSTGMASRNESFPADVTEQELLDLIDELNEDDDVHGILLQLPVSKHLNEVKLISSFDPMKDVDGLHPINACALENKNPGHRPATPYGIFMMFEEHNVQLEGANAVIINRSRLVGNPILKMLRNANATVTQCHSRTRDIGFYTRNADIIIAAAGAPDLIKPDMINEEKKTVIIDVSSPKGDCAEYFDEIRAKAGLITPVPGGVGPMTITGLLQNVYNSATKAYVPRCFE
ncbi:MAG: bifunctional 5,10-methylenetetrahydrofolate dehydrogenase/5,10-methenyltetrahydrofolate cyclohydrolase [Candidatus Heimdallarchaeota archaeon]|nr:bifunctional 5,10-methylenetetrahydrofolate dehydrogenase/5,10-methenyltetrahydrofolate cyclohydrolase [Candidatus Heimdallarchaeota archaeon]MCK5048980.1 bifunctional 5,10-methylenetetrahydrofolate dehydrogenase/5,10-methenyltetrahydrofolate cyclohydrolase [Candidatus Heimdallarchaeota archaeon]